MVMAMLLIGDRRNNNDQSITVQSFAASSSPHGSIQLVSRSCQTDDLEYFPNSSESEIVVDEQMHSERNDVSDGDDDEYVASKDRYLASLIENLRELLEEQSRGRHALKYHYHLLVEENEV